MVLGNQNVQSHIATTIFNAHIVANLGYESLLSNGLNRKSMPAAFAAGILLCVSKQEGHDYQSREQGTNFSVLFTTV